MINFRRDNGQNGQQPWNKRYYDFSTQFCLDFFCIYCEFRLKNWFLYIVSYIANKLVKLVKYGCISNLLSSKTKQLITLLSHYISDFNVSLLIYLTRPIADICKRSTHWSHWLQRKTSSKTVRKNHNQITIYNTAQLLVIAIIAQCVRNESNVLFSSAALNIVQCHCTTDCLYTDEVHFAREMYLPYKVN